MRNSFLSFFIVGATALALSPNLAAQVETHVQRLEKNGSGGPAPRRDLYGAWAGNIDANTIARTHFGALRGFTANCSSSTSTSARPA